jgi:hypothetical protein
MERVQVTGSFQSPGRTLMRRISSREVQMGRVWWIVDGVLVEHMRSMMSDGSEIEFGVES